jgi:hypothetical protein
MTDDEDTIPKTGGVKAMLASLKNKGLDTTEKDNDGTVPFKKSWKPPPKGENSQKDTAGGNETLDGDELCRIREQVSAKRGAAVDGGTAVNTGKAVNGGTDVNGGTAPGDPPPPPPGRGGPVGPGRGGRANGYTYTNIFL